MSPPEVRRLESPSGGSANVARMEPPEVRASMGPAALTAIEPPDVRAATRPAASSMRMAPPEVRASMSPLAGPSAMAPPEVVRRDGPAGGRDPNRPAGSVDLDRPRNFLDGDRPAGRAGRQLAVEVVDRDVAAGRTQREVVPVRYGQAERGAVAPVEEPAHESPVPARAADGQRAVLLLVREFERFGPLHDHLDAVAVMCRHVDLPPLGVEHQAVAGGDVERPALGVGVGGRAEQGRGERGGQGRPSRSGGLVRWHGVESSSV